MRRKRSLKKPIVLHGRQLRIVKSFNLALEGIKGIVVEETKKTIVLKREDGRITRVPKLGSLFELSYDSKRYLIEGGLLLGRVERRIKRA